MKITKMMQATTVMVVNGVEIPVTEFVIEQNTPTQLIDVLSYKAVKPGWLNVCECGQRHEFVDGDIAGASWVVVDTYWCDDCEDTHEETERQCVSCGRVVEPELVTVPEDTRRIVTGVTVYTIKGHVPLGNQLPSEYPTVMMVATDDGKVHGVYKGAFVSTGASVRPDGGYIEFEFQGIKHTE